MMAGKHSLGGRRMIIFLILLGLVLILTFLFDKTLSLGQIQIENENTLKNHSIGKMDSLDTKYKLKSGEKKKIPILTKIQEFLTSLPDGDKNTSQFISILNHINSWRNNVIPNTLKTPNATAQRSQAIQTTVEAEHASAVINSRNQMVQNMKIINKSTLLEISKLFHSSNTKLTENSINPERDSFRRKENSSVDSKQDTIVAVETLKDKPLCKADKHLIGRAELPRDVTVAQVTRPEALKRVKKGGIYSPEDCRPRDSVAIIIPYRDRQKHLEIFVNHMHPFLQRQQLQYGIFVVELARPTLFNRGLLANVGFLAAQSTGLYNCYVIHDVDLLPINDKNTYNCSRQFRHLSVANTKFNNGLPYLDYAGGVIALREDTYAIINGFSNLYFGWGGEDDDVWSRARDLKYRMERPDAEVGAYLALSHGKDALNPVNPERFRLVNEWKNRCSNEGLNSINYITLSQAALELYTHVYVRVNMTEVKQTNVVNQVSDIQLYESDLKTLRNKHTVNDKIINAYFWILQERDSTRILSMKSTLRYIKKPWFPSGLNTSKIEFLFVPWKQFGNWSLVVVFNEQRTIVHLDPTGWKNDKAVDLIRQAYHEQFNVDLTEHTNLIKDQAVDQDDTNSGILIMLFARRITTRKPLTFQQADINATRTEIETVLRKW